MTGYKIVFNDNRESITLLYNVKSFVFINNVMYIRFTDDNEKSLVNVAGIVPLM